MDQKQNGIRPYLFFNQIQTYRVHVEKKNQSAWKKKAKKLFGLENKGEKLDRPQTKSKALLMF